jgi:excisionase family DNA binding protein
VSRTDRSPPINVVSVRIPTAAAMLGIGRTKLYELISSGEIELIKIGKVSLIAVSSLQEFIDRHREASSTSDNPPKSRGRPRKRFVELAR